MIELLTLVAVQPRIARYLEVFGPVAHWNGKKLHKFCIIFEYDKIVLG